MGHELVRAVYAVRMRGGGNLGYGILGAVQFVLMKGECWSGPWDSESSASCVNERGVWAMV